MKELSELQVVQKMLGVLLRQQGLMQWVDCWAAGQNEGGMYVSLFNSRANFRICNVYSEKFSQLPDFIRNSIPDSGIEIGTEKERVAKKGLLKECPAFCITRYQLDAGDEKAKWHFGDVLYIKQSNKPQPPPPHQEQRHQAAPAAQAVRQVKPGSPGSPILPGEAIWGLRGESESQQEDPPVRVALPIKKVEIDPITALQIECESLGTKAYSAAKWGNLRAKFALRASKDRTTPVDKLADLTKDELTVIKDSLIKVTEANVAVAAN